MGRRKQAIARVEPGTPARAEPGTLVDRSWAQYVREANEALAMMRGEPARWWGYWVSHRTFKLLVGDPSGRGGNVVLRASGCQTVSGPVGWDARELEVVRHGSGDQAVYELRDEPAGFRATAEFFRWQMDFDLLNGEEEIGFR
jgi:hypothetical protein